MTESEAEAASAAALSASSRDSTSLSSLRRLSAPRGRKAATEPSLCWAAQWLGSWRKSVGRGPPPPVRTSPVAGSMAATSSVRPGGTSPCGGEGGGAPSSANGLLA